MIFLPRTNTAGGVNGWFLPPTNIMKSPFSRLFFTAVVTAGNPIVGNPTLSATHLPFLLLVMYIYSLFDVLYYPINRSIDDRSIDRSTTQSTMMNARCERPATIVQSSHLLSVDERVADTGKHHKSTG